MDEPRLGVAAAARRLGIAPATLRTWDRRYRIGPTGHVPGRHRRYSPEDLARLELMQHALLRGASPGEAARYARAAGLPRPDAGPPARPHVVPPAVPVTGPGPDGIADPDAAGGALLIAAGGTGELGARVRAGGRALRLPGAGRRARGLGRAALALDAGAVRTLLGESIGTVGLESTWDDVVRPVLAAIGDPWASTGAGVEIEHLVSECVIGAFGTAAAAPVGDLRPVLLAGMPGEQHTVPLVVLAAVLARRGVGCRSLGANLPADALVAAARRTAPAAVVLWSQLPDTADTGVLRSLPRPRAGRRTFAAGPGWAAAALPVRVVWLESLSAAGDTITAAVLV